MHKFQMECDNCTKILEVNSIDEIIVRIAKSKNAGKKLYLKECPVCHCRTEVPDWHTEMVREAMETPIPVVFDRALAVLV